MILDEKIDIYNEVDNFVEENEGEVTHAEIARHFFELGRNNAIDKACKWLGGNFRVSSFDDTKIVTHFSSMFDVLASFRKAMEED